MCVEGSDVEKVNDSTIHVDFMIGSSDVRVLGLDAAGAETPILADGAWQV
jgi:aminopeptidase